MTLLIVSEKELRDAISHAFGGRLEMLSKAQGETLDTIAEREVIEYLVRLKKEIHDSGGFEIRLSLRSVFLAGYAASEERKWK